MFCFFLSYSQTPVRLLCRSHSKRDGLRFRSFRSSKEIEFLAHLELNQLCNIHKLLQSTSFQSADPADKLVRKAREEIKCMSSGPKRYFRDADDCSGSSTRTSRELRPIRYKHEERLQGFEPSTLDFFKKSKPFQTHESKVARHSLCSNLLYIYHREFPPAPTSPQNCQRARVVSLTYWSC